MPGTSRARTPHAGRIAAYRDTAIIVEGRTDNVGGAAYNARLSQARAESVRAFLLSAGTAGPHYAAQGLGATRPVARTRATTGASEIAASRSW